jgi:LPXTG-site transpeptidase (sortase) family protein
MSLKRLPLLLIIAALVALPPFLRVHGSAPASISIPILNISSSIEEFPLSGHSWKIDQWDKGIGHLEGTAWLGEPGNMVFAGHSRMPDMSDGIFAALDKLATGDTITVSDGSQEWRYSVTDVRSVDYKDVSVVYPTDSDQITLITCDVGSYNNRNQQYARRVVVVAQRVN